MNQNLYGPGGVFDPPAPNPPATLSDQLTAALTEAQALQKLKAELGRMPCSPWRTKWERKIEDHFTEAANPQEINPAEDVVKIRFSYLQELWHAFATNAIRDIIREGVCPETIKRLESEGWGGPETDSHPF